LFSRVRESRSRGHEAWSGESASLSLDNVRASGDNEPWPRDHELRSRNLGSWSRDLYSLSRDNESRSLDSGHFPGLDAVVPGPRARVPRPWAVIPGQRRNVWRLRGRVQDSRPLSPYPDAKSRDREASSRGLETWSRNQSRGPAAMGRSPRTMCGASRSSRLSRGRSRTCMEREFSRRMPWLFVVETVNPGRGGAA
jgi:hypothetical protein